MPDADAPRILIVDDVPKNIQVLGSILLKENYNISFANDGTKAIELAESNELDLILLDVMMPGIDGFETCRRLKLKDKTQDIPIIFMTALSDTSDKVKGFEAGAVDYVTKPFETEEILARVKTHLTIRKLRHDLEERIKELELHNRFIRRTFGRYLTDDVVESLLESPERLKVGGEKREVTILLSDLRGFSSITEGLTPENVVMMLNTYLSVMTDVIVKYGGTIDEFIGDAILVLFGAPFKKEDHAERAVACAIAMQQAIEEVNIENRKNGFPPVEMGIGINSGEVVVGNIGSQKRAKYGVVGRNVNLASRIESYTVGNQILISETTYKKTRAVVETKKSVKVNPKGVQEPITIYDVRAITGEFNLLLPDFEEECVQLDTPQLLRYVVLDEKSADQIAQECRMIELCSHKAVIRADEEIPRFSNLKILVMKDGTVNENNAIYAKVVEVVEDQGNEYLIHFTSVPQAVRSQFTKLMDA